MERSFQLEDNDLTFKTMTSNSIEGVKLTESEKAYLLPHFMMILVGKPGSGKTTMLKQMITNQQMYGGKFDEILIVSPSHAKMGIEDIPQDKRTSQFSLDWITKQIDSANTEQLKRMFGSDEAPQSRMTGQDKVMLSSEKFGGAVIQTRSIDGTARTVRDTSSRFNLYNVLKDIDKGDEARAGEQHSNKSTEESKSAVYKKIDTLPYDVRDQTNMNMLIVLDDVVGQIKRAEFDPRLAQLIMNRRHLLYNGTISIIIVTQKYTLVPARLRSNASWLLMYQLNPMDFECIYRDAVIHDRKTWEQLVQTVFGDGTEDDGENDDETKKKTFDHYAKTNKHENIGIWVEYNVFFANFKRIKMLNTQTRGTYT